MHRGPAEVRDMIAAWHGGFEELRFEPRELLDPGGERFAIRYEMIGRAGGGIELREDQWSVFSFRGGLCERQIIFWSEAGALQAMADPEHLG